MQTFFLSDGTHEPINLSFFSGWHLDDVENYMEKIWNAELFDYYEEWYG